jgi:hypothetical protein
MLTGIGIATEKSLNNTKPRHAACAHFLWITLCATMFKRSKGLISKEFFEVPLNEALRISNSHLVHFQTKYDPKGWQSSLAQASSMQDLFN